MRGKVGCSLGLTMPAFALIQIAGVLSGLTSKGGDSAVDCTEVGSAGADITGLEDTSGCGDV